MKRACLSGKDIADLLNGECVKAHGTEFVFDGDGFRDVIAAFENYKKRSGQSAPRPPSTATARPPYERSSTVRR